MKRLLWLALAVALFAVIDEGLHTLVAGVVGAYDPFRVRPFGFEVVLWTPVDGRQGLQWAAISGAPNAATVLLGFLLLAWHQPLARNANRFARNTAYWWMLLLPIADLLNLSLGPFIYGGDTLGIAVGLGMAVWVVQALAFALFLVNRELLAQVPLPSFGVASTHPLFKALDPASGSVPCRLAARGSPLGDRQDLRLTQAAELPEGSV